MTLTAAWHPFPWLTPITSYGVLVTRYIGQCLRRKQMVDRMGWTEEANGGLKWLNWGGYNWRLRYYASWYTERWKFCLPGWGRDFELVNTLGCCFSMSRVCGSRNKEVEEGATLLTVTLNNPLSRCFFPFPQLWVLLVSKWEMHPPGPQQWFNQIASWDCHLAT